MPHGDPVLFKQLACEQHSQTSRITRESSMKTVKPTFHFPNISDFFLLPDTASEKGFNIAGGIYVRIYLDFLIAWNWHFLPPNSCASCCTSAVCFLCEQGVCHLQS